MNSNIDTGEKYRVRLTRVPVIPVRCTVNPLLSPQLRLIHIRQLFRTQYAVFRLDTGNIYWWWCILFCRVLSNTNTNTSTNYDTNTNTNTNTKSLSRN